MIHLRTKLGVGVAVLTMALGTKDALTAQGATKQVCTLPVNISGCVTYAELPCDWKAQLEQWNIDCDKLQEILDNCGKPETDAPEQDQPDVDVPEQNKPGTDAPEQNAPGIEGTLSEAEVVGRRITELVNEHRVAAGLSKLEYSVELSNATAIRAIEIQKSFSHTRPDGRAFSSVLSDNGISYRMSGENIAWGQKSAEAVVEAWMNSSGHRANILKPGFTKLGVGYAVKDGVKYFTQLFTD